MSHKWKNGGCVVVCSREGAQRYLNAKSTKRDIEAVVSLGGTQAHGVDKARHKLVLNFQDYEREPTQQEIDCGLSFTYPTFDHVVRIRNFLEPWRRWFMDHVFSEDATYTRMLFHCEQGVSRSPAAALVGFAMAREGRGIDEARKAVDLLKRHCDEVAAPNRLMVHHTDNLLEYNGMLIKAVDEMWEVRASGLIVPKFT